MATGHADLSDFFVSVAWGLSLFLQPLLAFLERSPARSPALDAAVAAAVLAIVVVFFVGAVLVYLYVLAVQAAAAPSPPPAAPWRFVALLVSVLLVVIELPLVVFFLHALYGPVRP